MKIRAGVLLFLLFISACGCNEGTAGAGGKRPAVNFSLTRLKAGEALAYCREKDFSTSVCLLVDMSLHSGVNRFIVWDFDKDTILYSFPVGHGCCNNPWSADASRGNPVFSNVDGSHCSSLGKYRIGERGYSDWGVNVKYLMHGLEPTNSNALKRQIVFHAWEMVSDVEIYPDGTPEGWGCPTLSNNNFRKVDPILKTSDKPVLLWIYR